MIEINNNDLIDKLLKFIFFSFPFLYISGSLLINSASVILIFYFFLEFKKSDSFLREKIKKNRIFLSIIILFILLNCIFSETGISYSNEDPKTYTLVKSFSYLRFIFFFYVGAYFFACLKNSGYKSYSLILFSAIIFTIIDTLIQYYVGKDIFGFNAETSYNRLSGPFGDELIVGIYLFIFGLLALAFIQRFLNWSNFLILLFLVFLFFTILLSGERTAFLSIFIFLFFLFLLNKEHRKKTFVYFLSLIILFFITINFNQDIKSKYNFKILPTPFSENKVQDENSKIVLNSKKNEQSTVIVPMKKNFLDIYNIFLATEWAAHYRGAGLIFKDNYILGSGIKSYRFECRKYAEARNKVICENHAHNIYFEILSDAGIIGIIIFLTFIFYTVKRFFNLKLYKDYSACIVFSLFLTIMFPFKPSGSIFSTNYAFLIWIIVIHLYSFYYKHEKKIISK